jgi:hypothetical protein
MSSVMRPFLRRMRIRARTLGSLVVCCAGLGNVVAADVQLAENGTTRYGIVRPVEAQPVDTYAAQVLAGYLKQITGAEFPVLVPEDMNNGRNYIFVGLPQVVRDVLGGDPLAELEDEEHVAKTVDGNILLYGKGIHGNLWAVMEFLENSLGWRWYSVHEEPVVPNMPTVTLAPFDRKRRFSITYRQVQLNFGSDFYYQNGINMGFALKKRGPKYISKLPSTRFVHSSFSYIPPTPSNRAANRFEWQDKKNYFETNPDFFTLNEFGRRVPNKQLCFSNPSLRKELTRNVIRDIEHAKKLPGEGLIITIDAADTGGKFCYCPGCQALEERYQNTGGPLYDAIIELCSDLRTNHPGVMVRTLAYRRSQTQHPPVLPPGVRFPENVVVAFAPIEDAYHADWWNHRDANIQETYRDMLGWGRITNHLWTWIYPNPWGTGAIMPVGNIERLVNNMRLMAVAGLEGLFADHQGINQRNSFHELQAYLLLKLMQNIDCDTDAVIKEFTDHHYGAAAPLLRTYISELEQGRKAMAPPPGVTYNSKNFDDQTFPYLTVGNITKWQHSFDRMEALTTDQPKHLLHVQTVRRKLDFATLWKWLSLKEAHPDYFADHEAIAARIRTTNTAVSKKFQVRPVGSSIVADFLLKIKAGGKQPPLPAQFGGVDPTRVRQFVPIGRRATSPYVEDADAAFGYAAPVHLPDMPFRFGFHQNDWATRDAAALPRLPKNAKATWTRALNRTFTLQRRITADEIVPGEYRVYELGEVEVSPHCMVWFSARSWGTHLELGKRLYEPGAENRWQVHVSMKFNGPTYGGGAQKDQVLVDRIILVPTSKDQFK